MRNDLPLRGYVRAIVQHQLHLPGVVLAILLLCQPTTLHAQSSSAAPVPSPPPATPQPAPASAPASAQVPAPASIPAATDATSTTQTGNSAPPPVPTPQPQADTPAPPPAPVVDMSLVHSVITTALEFLGPRTLEPHSSRDFTLWGLGCLSALDPTLTFDSRGASIQLLAGPQPLLSRPAPPADSTEEWARLATDFLEAARAHSAAVRSAGRDDLLQAFFDELFNHLDPYSRYIGPSSASTDREARTGGEADAGITLAQSGRYVVVSAINANGPAWTSEIDTGDRIIAVNNQLTAGQSAATVTDWLRGPEDSALILRLLSPGRRRAHTVTLRRTKVPPETVFAFASGPIVVLKVTAFSSDTAEEMSQYLDQATQDKNLRGLIIDLRGNRGGVLQQAVTAAALLLDHGVAAVTSGRDPQSNHIWAVQGGDMTNGLPIAVLVDGRTASAAEILAAALADHRRAVVIGSETLGKGLVQTVAQLPDEGELFVTWSRVIAPLHWPLQGLGVMPQICTSLGEADTNHALHMLATGKLANQAAITASRAARYPLTVPSILAIRKACPAALGNDRDVSVARELINHPAWYKTATTAIPDDVASVPQVSAAP